MLFAAALAAAAAPLAARASVEISTAKTRHMVCDAGACVPSAKNAVLNVKDLAAMLQAGDAKVFTGNGALNIEITAPFSWTGTSRLTLSAYQSVNVKAAVTVAGPGAVTVATNVAGNGGELFFAGGELSFWDTTSDLVINGNPYALFNDIPSLATAIAANPSGRYALGKDYDAFVDGIYPHAAIPTVFTGDLRGLGHTIDRVSMSTASSDSLGLFAQIDAPGSVSSIRLTNLSIQSTGAAIGGVAAVNGGTIRDAIVSGTLTGGDDVGGVAADNQGLILDSQAAVQVAGVFEVGGLVAENNDGGNIQGCHASGSVRSDGNSGGLVAYSQSAIVESSSSATATISFFGTLAGGLVAYGNSEGSIVRSFATGAVSQERNKRGGRAGHKHGPKLGGLTGASQGLIQDSYATGSVSGAKGAVGGVTGVMNPSGGVLRQVYATGALALRGGGYLGGVIGLDYSEADAKTNAYWDLGTSGVADTSKGAGNTAFDKGLKGLTTGQLKSGLPKGFDPAVWDQSASVNDGYPYLLANPPQQQGAK